MDKDPSSILPFNHNFITSNISATFHNLSRNFRAPICTAFRPASAHPRTYRADTPKTTKNYLNLKVQLWGNVTWTWFQRRHCWAILPNRCSASRGGGGHWDSGRHFLEVFSSDSRTMKVRSSCWDSKRPSGSVLKQLPCKWSSFRSSKPSNTPAGSSVKSMCFKCKELCSECQYQCPLLLLSPPWCKYDVLMPSTSILTSLWFCPSSSPHSPL